MKWGAVDAHDSSVWSSRRDLPGTRRRLPAAAEAETGRPLHSQEGRRRNDEGQLTESEGRFEQERLEFHQRVADGYRTLAAASPQRFRLVDASGLADAVERRVAEALADMLPVVLEESC